MAPKSKSENNYTPPVNLILIDVFCKLLLSIGDSILLGVGGVKLECEVLDVSGEDEKFKDLNFDGYFILYDIYEF